MAGHINIGTCVVHGAKLQRTGALHRFPRGQAKPYPYKPKLLFFLSNRKRSPPQSQSDPGKLARHKVPGTAPSILRPEKDARTRLPLPPPVFPRPNHLAHNWHLLPPAHRRKFLLSR